MLNFYFEFEEVITAVPEGWTGTPTVGDTLRITNGHLTQYPLLLEDRVFEK